MPRKPSLEIRLRCNKCKKYTQSTNPIIINKEVGNRFYIKTVCSICNKYKNKYLNIKQVNLLPDEIKQAPDNTTFTDTIERNGGIIPLLPLIGAIAAGVNALTSVADTTSSIVLATRKANEEERHHRQLEDIAKGGLVNPISINGIKINEQKEYTNARTEQSCDIPVEADRSKPVETTMSDDELINKSIEFLTDKGFSVSI